MPTLTWDVQGTRLYFTGVDRGMLYVGDDVAVPWPGLTAVTENPSGGDPQPFYLDGTKILNTSAGEDFAATIESLGAPDEFAPCAGRVHLSTGLYAANQVPKTFSFSYRTLIGNDLSGIEYGYKLHVVYNATAKIADYVHTTNSDSPSVKTYSFDITTVPVTVDGYRPTSHFVFDTRYVNDFVVARLEQILYGDDTHDPRLPTPEELVTLLTDPGTTSWWDLTGLPDFPVEAQTGDMGVDFSNDDMYADVEADTEAFWWDLTGGQDFPAEASIGDWGYDTSTGEVFQFTG
jgi:hypothetical protein